MVFRKVEEYRYQVAILVEARHLLIGEVRSDDIGGSWIYRAFNERGYVLEGVCTGLDSGVRSILWALWGNGSY